MTHTDDRLRAGLSRIYPLHVESADYVCPDCGGVNTCPVVLCANGKSVPRAEMLDIEQFFLTHEGE